MRNAAKPTKDDVARLIRGRPSLNKIGSRAVSHRLRGYELEKLQLAKERGYLAVGRSTREALLNAWFLWCEATGTPYRIEPGTS